MLHEFLDDELPPAQRAAVIAHLDTCPACTQQVADMQALFGRFETWPDLPLALQALAGALLLAVIWPGAQKWAGGFLR